jgi:Protein of unknown function (DUF402)
VTWSPGETIVLQEVWRDRVWAARPMVVVRDEGDLLVLWFPKGTSWKAPTTPPDWPREPNRGVRLATCAARGEWALRDLLWEVDTLSLTRAGDWHSVWVSWPEDGSDWGWYINLQRPFRRSPIGLETMDLALDVLINLDRSWRWKDEDESTERLAFPDHYWVRDEAAVRAEGWRVVKQIEAGDFPFDGTWTDFQPDPSWVTPTELPAGWDRPVVVR